MILLSPDAVEDVARLRSFLDQNNPDAAQRALALIWTAIDRLQEFPNLGMPTGDADIRQIVVGLARLATSCATPPCPGPKTS
jgi:toxin ParE1/3/4